LLSLLLLLLGVVVVPPAWSHTIQQTNKQTNNKLNLLSIFFL